MKKYRVWICYMAFLLIVLLINNSFYENNMRILEDLDKLIARDTNEIIEMVTFIRVFDDFNLFSFILMLVQCIIFVTLYLLLIEKKKIDILDKISINIIIFSPLILILIAIIFGLMNFINSFLLLFLVVINSFICAYKNNFFRKEN